MHSGMGESFDVLLHQFSGERLPGQPRLPVHVDTETRRLELGGITLEVDLERGNRGILEAFVELVTELRHERPDSVRQLRRIDLAELGRVLDLSDRELERDLQDVLDMSSERAHRVADRLTRIERARRNERLHERAR